jgi:glycosyltransferase involved in cell wall biosynthesis
MGAPMKLVIQIPAFNEADHLPETLAALPKSLPGIDDILVLVIDDGSTDGTASVASRLGAEVLRLPSNRGLAHAFMSGIDASLALGADVIVNTDADNQYRGDSIEALIRPVLAGVADFVVGARPIEEIAAFSPVKKFLQRFGSWVVRSVSGAPVADVTSGFRALNREAALQINVFSRYTYTLETIVHAAQRRMRIASVPVAVNLPTRKSRLVRSNANYVWRTGSALARILVVYRPFRSFMIPALGLFGIASLIAIRFVVYFIVNHGAAGHTQSLILSAILFGMSGVLMAVAFIGDLLAINRRLLEDLRLDARRRRFGASGGSTNA